MTNWSGARWWKSSVSDGGGCVEIANVSDAVGVRDSKQNGHGPIIELKTAKWNEFVAGCVRGNSDRTNH